MQKLFIYLQSEHENFNKTNFYMKKSLRIILVAALAIAAIGCSSLKKMQEQAENVIVTCDPQVLECIAGSIDATVTVTYPADYFNPKAILEVTPVLVYDGGEVVGEKLYYQGPKVQENYTVVSPDGQTVTEKIHFDYVKGVEKSVFELRGVAMNKKRTKTAELPSKKVADGVNTTYMLVQQGGVVGSKADSYQEVIPSTAEGQIQFAYNSSELRNSELKGQSMKDFLAALDEITSNNRKTVTGTEIISYASPEGSVELNDALSEKRGESGNKAWNKLTKKYDIASPDVQSKGEDWDGFQKLVGESNIEDKDLILRVLSMYSDPNVRESEIRNMSEVFTTLKSEVLPGLRRSRLIANVEYQNYTADELKQLAKDDIDALDEEALLRAATLVEDNAEKEKIYKQAIDKFDSNRAKLNLAALYMAEGKKAEAEQVLATAADDADAKATKGVIALRNGDQEAAEKYFAESGTPEAQASQGALDILNGKYDKAASELANAPGCKHNTALAYILVNKLDQAAAVLNNCADKCCCAPKCAYLKAIIAARQGKESEVKANLEKAYEDAELKERAKTDIEFADYNL